MATVKTNQAPYFDDYNEDKKFYRILFRPGYPVQARELTQMQTLLQKQIERIGSHIFENGAQVLPGSKEGVKYLNNIHWIKIRRSYYADTRDQLTTYWLNKTIVSTTGAIGIKAVVIGFEEADAFDEARLYLNYIQADSSAGTTSTFSSGQGFQTVETVPINAVVADGEYPTGVISSVIVEEGVYFYNGYFVLVDKQQIFIKPTDETDLSAWNNRPTALVGLKMNESIITPEEDDTLLDNAQGSPNYSAPGAHRLYIEAILEQRNINNSDTDFVPLLKVVNGTVQNRVVKTEYSVIEDTLARRTYDESGDYTITPFMITVRDFLDNGKNKGIHSEEEFHYFSPGDAAEASVNIFGLPAPGKYCNHPKIQNIFLPGNSYNEPGDAQSFIQLCKNKLSIKIDPGKAYVKGYEIWKIATNIVDVDRARTLHFVNNRTISTPLGTYLYVQNLYGTPRFDLYKEVELHANRLNENNPSITPGNKIGTARLLSIEFFSGINGTDTGIYRLFLFDIKTTEDGDIKQLKSVWSTSPTFACNVVLNTSRLLGSVMRGSTAGNNTGWLIGSGTGWKNDETQRLDIYDYILVGLGANAKIFQIVDHPENDNRLLVSPDPSLILEENVNYTISYLSADVQGLGETASLIYKLPDDTIYTLRGSSADGQITPQFCDTVYTSKRVYTNLQTTSQGSLTLTISAQGEEFEDFSPMDYVLICTDTGKWFQLIPYVNGNLSRDGIAEVQALGDTVTFYCGSDPVHGYPNKNMFVLASIIRNGGVGPVPNAASEKAKQAHVGKFVNGEYVGPYIVTSGSDISTISLGKTDVMAITRIVESPNYNEEPSNLEVLPPGHKNITGAYYLDNGQRDYYYDIAKAILLPGAQRPKGKIRIEFDWLQHTSGQGNYFSVDSYPFKGTSPTIEYEDIPLYHSPKGGRYDLANCIDFRPRVKHPEEGPPTEFATYFEVPRDNFRCDYWFYEHRIDKLYLDRSGVFMIKRGVPGPEPETPAEPDTGMTIYELYMRAYTANPSDCVPKMIDNRRYTMRDIGRLEKRIKNLEYYTSLTLLEKETSELTIKDALGYDKFKNGFLVDNFSSKKVCDLQHPDFRCALDEREQVLRPIYYEDAIRLKERYMYVSNLVAREAKRLSKHYQKTGDIYTLPYKKKIMVEQVQCSKVVNINPYHVFTFVGVVELNPWSDEWRDTRQMEPWKVVDESQYQAMRSGFGPDGTSISYGSVINSWTGIDISQENTGITRLLFAGHADVNGNRNRNNTPQKRIGSLVVTPEGYANEGQMVPYAGVSMQSDLLRITTTLTGEAIQNGVKSSIIDMGMSEPISFGNRIVDIEEAPWIRSRTVLVTGKAFMPNAKLFAYFDGVNVTNSCRTFSGNYISNEEGGELIPIGPFGNWGDLKTDSKGQINIQFVIPARRFRTGDRIFRLTMSSTNETIPAPESWGEARYTARGWVDVKQETTYSTRLYRINVQAADPIVNPIEMSDSTLLWSAPCPRDPIAESFFVYEDGGCFITNIDVFFYSKSDKDDNEKPLIFQVRTLDDGGNPSNIILPFGEVVKDASEVVTNVVDLKAGTLTVTYEGNYPEQYLVNYQTTNNPFPNHWVRGTGFFKEDDINGINGTPRVGNKSGLMIPNGVPIQLSKDPSLDMVPTRFTFSSPIYLAKNNSYCFVCISDSDKYHVWAAQSGPDINAGREGIPSFREAGEINTKIGTSDPITKDPYIQGILFKSQNGISWTPDQTMDIKFAIHKAEFDTSINGEIDFVNVDIPRKTLPLDPFETKAGSTLVRVLHPNHGLPPTGDSLHPLNAYATKVVFSDVASAGNGISIESLTDNRGFSVQYVELDYYIIDLSERGYAAATQSGRIGGRGVKATENKRFESAVLITTPLVLPGTDISWNLECTSGRGVHDNVNVPYKVMPARNIAPNVMLKFDKPMMIACGRNEKNSYEEGPGQRYPGPDEVVGTKSLTLKAILKSNNPNISPIIDESRMSFVTISNRIDNPAGFIPLGSSVPEASVINHIFDDYTCLPTNDPPAVSASDLQTTKKIWFTSSSALLRGTNFVANPNNPVEIIGTNSYFLVDLKVGNVLIEPNTNEKRIVISIIDNTHLIINSAFTSLSGILHVEPPPCKLKTANADVAAHLSKLDVGKLLCIRNTTDNKRDVENAYILKVNYNPTNTVVDADLNAPVLCEIVYDQINTSVSSGYETGAYSIVQKDRYIDEIAPSGGSVSSKYVCKKLVLASPANALKIMFDAYRDKTNTIDVYYKLDMIDETTPLDNLNWQLAEYNVEIDGKLIPATPLPNSNPDEFSSYEVNLLDLPKFYGVQVKIVMRGGNPARCPRIKNFRIIAIEE